MRVISVRGRQLYIVKTVLVIIKYTVVLLKTLWWREIFLKILKSKGENTKYKFIFL